MEQMHSEHPQEVGNYSFDTKHCQSVWIISPDWMEAIL